MRTPRTSRGRTGRRVRILLEGDSRFDRGHVATSAQWESEQASRVRSLDESGAHRMAVRRSTEPKRDANGRANERRRTEHHRTSRAPTPTAPAAVQDGRNDTRRHSPLSSTRSRAEMFDALGDEIQVSDEIQLTMHLSADLEDIASLRVGGLFYPALAVPVGPGDETLQCPDLHSSLLWGRLADMPKINLLVVGYSGLDTVVAGLLARSGRPLGRLLVIEPDQDRATRAAQELAGGVGSNRDTRHGVRLR